VSAACGVVRSGPRGCGSSYFGVAGPSLPPVGAPAWRSRPGQAGGIRPFALQALGRGGVEGQDSATRRKRKNEVLASSPPRCESCWEITGECRGIPGSGEVDGNHTVPRVQRGDPRSFAHFCAPTSLVSCTATGGEYGSAAARAGLLGCWTEKLADRGRCRTAGQRAGNRGWRVRGSALTHGRSSTAPRVAGVTAPTMAPAPALSRPAPRAPATRATRPRVPWSLTRLDRARFRTPPRSGSGAPRWS
jgi:hypothetical protein